MSWTNLPTDYEDAEYSGLRKYTMIENEDDTVSFQDVTEYENYENSFYKAEDVNRAYEAINNLVSQAEEGTSINVSDCQGRLTYVSNDPCPGSDITAADILYFTPYNGNKISLYVNGVWRNLIFSEISLSLSGLTNEIPYDVFIELNLDGDPVLSVLSWGNVSARPSNTLTRLNGILVRSTDMNKRYIGTFVLNASGKGEDCKNGRLLWNEYNRIPRSILAKLVTTKVQGTNHINSWAPYYDNDAPAVKLLVPSADCDFSLTGVGINSSISESDRGYLRAAALGICQDITMDSPYTGNTNCADIFTHTCGNTPMTVSISNVDERFLGFHSYTLAFWSNYNFYPTGTSLSASMGECPGLQGVIYA